VNAILLSLASSILSHLSLIGVQLGNPKQRKQNEQEAHRYAKVLRAAERRPSRRGLWHGNTVTRLLNQLRLRSSCR
jgi:hypothetical protein